MDVADKMYVTTVMFTGWKWHQTEWCLSLSQEHIVPTNAKYSALNKALQYDASVLSFAYTMNEKADFYLFYCMLSEQIKHDKQLTLNTMKMWICFCHKGSGIDQINEHEQAAMVLENEQHNIFNKHLVYIDLVYF